MKDPGGPTTQADALLRELARAPDASPQELELRPGALLGRFEVLKALGRGGFGTVYEARDTDLGRHVAVKVLRLRERPGHPAAVAREEFKREAATVARLEHPNIVTIYDFGSAGERSYLVLELLRGETLAQRLRRGALRPQEGVAIVLQIARGLAHAHRLGVIHSDVKPANVFLREDGSVKLLDFGIARLTGESVAGPLGTAAYMAPEQWRGEGADARSDLFSAGVVLYQLITGALPFPEGAKPGVGPAPSLRASVPDIPLPLEELAARALSLEPALRPQSAEAFAAALLGLERTLWDASAQSEQPYRYLETFSEADEGWFFARSLEVRRLAGLLADAPMAAVVGPSGAGKSSLVLAGLLPRLRREGPWSTLVLRPGARPFARLREGLLATLDASLSCPSEDELRDKPGLVGRLLREQARVRSTQVLLVVDQLEELFVNSVEPQLLVRFAMALAGAADDAGGLTRVVLTVREDFLGRLVQLAPLRDQLGSNLLVLAPPGEDGLREALCAPAERLGFSVETAARDEILRALSGLPAPLPLLQLAASRLWEKRDLAGRLLTRAALASFGGVTGVLAAHAEEVLRGLPSAADQELARALICELVTGSRTRGQRAVAELAQDRGAALRVLDHLIQGRIVTSFRGETGQVVELSHESLIAGWGRLAGWLDDAHEALRFRDRVSASAALWDERGRPADLLWTGRTLEAALEWRGGQLDAPAAGASAFIQASDERARRSRRVRRTLTTGAIAAGLLLVAGLALGVRASRETARIERTRAILAAADGSKDPLASALALLELRDGPEPVGAASIAARVLEQPLAALVHRGHGTGPYSVMFSPDGSHLVTAGWDGTARVWPASGNSAPVVLRHGAELSDAVYSPDGASIAAVSRDGTTKLWSAAGGEPRLFAGEGQILHRVRFSPDGTRLVTAGNDRAARIFRLDGQGAPVVLRGHEGTVWWVEFSADGSHVVTASEDTTARVWRADGQGTPLVLRGHTGILRGARFSPDGRRVVTVGDDGTARIWSTEVEAPAVLLPGHRGRIWRAAWSPDGTRVATAGLDGTARVWRADGAGEPLVLRGHQGQVMSVSFHPSGAYVLTASADGTARIWALEGAVPPTVFGRHEMGIFDAAFSPDGTRLATISDDRTVRVYRVELPNSNLFPTGDEGTVTAVAFSPDGATLAAGGVGGVIRLWDVAGQKPPRVLATHGARVVEVGFSPDAARLAAISMDSTATVYPVDGLTPPIRLEGQAGAGHFQWSPDGKRIASAGGSVRLWRSDGSLERVFAGHKAVVYRVFFSPDGKRIVTASADGTARVWPLSGGEPVVLTGHTGALAHADFSPDGTRVVTAGDDGTARIWPSDGHGTPVILAGHRERVVYANFSPDGTQVLTSSADDTARVWSVDGRTSRVIGVHGGDVFRGVFTADGQRIITAAFDGTVRVFRSSDGFELLALPGGIGPLWRLVVSGRHVVLLSNTGGGRLLTIDEWPTLLDRMAAASQACLSPAQRGLLLGEPGVAAEKAFAACEHRQGREPPRQAKP